MRAQRSRYADYRRVYAGTLGPANAPTVRGRLRASIDAGRAVWRERKPGGRS